MAKEKHVKALNDYSKPYNLTMTYGQGNAATPFLCSVQLTLMDEIKVVEGRSVQATNRIVNTSAFGLTAEESKDKALKEALDLAGVI